MKPTISYFVIGLVLTLSRIGNTRDYKTVSTTVDLRFADCEDDVIFGTTNLLGTTMLNSRKQFIKTLKNSRGLSWTHVLIIGLGNDVNPNPGPPSGSSFNDPPAPCGICDDEVGYYPVKGIQCEECEKWNHATCINMSSKTYNLLANTSTSWICDGCGHPNYSDSLINIDFDFQTENPFSPLDSDQSLNDVQPLATSSPKLNKGKNKRFDFTRTPKEKHANKTKPEKKTRAKKLTILNINFQSIKNKTIEFLSILHEQKPDIVIGTETWLNSSILDAELFPPEYAIFRKDRPDGWGGVLIAVKGLSCHLLDDLNSDSECIWVRVECGPKKKVYVGAFYNPDTSHEPIDLLNLSLSKLHQKTKGNCEIWLGGDFNLKDINWPDQSVKTGSNFTAQCKKFIDICNFFSLDQLVTEPTRKDSILDLFLVSNPTIVEYTKVLPGLSDHSMVKIHVNTGCSTAKPARRKFFLYKKASGPDNIPNKILKECSVELAPLLSALFNQSISTGVLPDDWTTANVSPVFKKGSKSDANDGLLYREVNSSSDAASLQSDLDALCRWESEWEMKFNSDKCFVMHMTTKKNPAIHPYEINGRPLQTTTNHPYLGLIFSSDCTWSSHINKITTNAKQTTGIIRRNFKSCSRNVKSRLYQSLVRPKLEYGVCGWAPFTEGEKKQLEGIQRFAARMCCNNYTRKSSVTAMLQELGWPLLETRRTIARLNMLYKITHELVDVQHELKTQTRTHRRSHQYSYHRVHAKSKVYSTSFYPSTIPHWNDLPEAIINITKLEQFKTAVADHLVKGGKQNYVI
ncbi:uncharacterized protein [Amphiura filiformis]|uniref:uncharacterized protein n=1 Tax=Amphiura filiformis TaxID=82378 RepID=UPI003B21D4FD